MKTKIELPIITFETQEAFTNWMNKNHKKSDGLWIRMFKKDTGIATINHDLALDVALCFGWIDSQAKKYDEKSYLQKFTPRRTKSIWSKRNIEHIERLTKAGLMQEGGFKEIERAKEDGRWQQAYDAPSEMKVPEDFLAEVAKSKKAKAFFDTLNKTNTYAIAWKLQTAKRPETREKRKKVLLEMMENQKKLH